MTRLDGNIFADRRLESFVTYQIATKQAAFKAVGIIKIQTSTATKRDVVGISIDKCRLGFIRLHRPAVVGVG